MSVHALKTAKVANLKSKVSAEEWQARVDLAACYRLLAKEREWLVGAGVIDSENAGDLSHEP